MHELETHEGLPSANVDRNLMMWQKQHYPNATKGRAASYGFPSVSVPCEGHGLDDVIATAKPFDRTVAMGGATKESGTFLTNRDVVNMDGRGEDQLYTYADL